MYHLYTEIKANLNDKSYIGLIDRLHPTPALGGYPKEEALDFIENKEFGTRGLYARRWAILMFMMIVNSLLLYVLC